MRVFTSCVCAFYMVDRFGLLYLVCVLMFEFVDFIGCGGLDFCGVYLGYMF